MTERENEEALEPQQLTHDEQEDLTEAEPATSQVTYSGQDFDVNGLVRRLNNDDIKVPQFGHNDPDIEAAGFQRGFVWRRPQMDRFIESLLLGFPIPGIFLVRQSDRRYLVLDGQQRILTLRDFYEGVHGGREFALRNVSERFRGIAYRSLSDELRRTLDNTFIQATIVDTDGTPQSLDAVYQIFERLNTGGTQLTPHEIRVALYAGPLVDLLEELNQIDSWRSLYGPPSPRIRDQELVLRVLALYLDRDSYSRPLKSFLNDFVAEHRDASDVSIGEASALFEQASEVLLEGPGRAALRKSSTQVNAAQTEAVFVGLMRTLQSGPVEPAEATRVIDAVKSNQAFDGAVERATADEDNVTTRLRIALECFSSAR
jgi:hypothetical protein